MVESFTDTEIPAPLAIHVIGRGKQIWNKVNVGRSAQLTHKFKEQGHTRPDLRIAHLHAAYKIHGRMDAMRRTRHCVSVLTSIEC